MIKFEHDEEGYFRWLTSHPAGYVLNVRSEPAPKYVVLHRASCGSISSTKRAPQAYTGKSYRKWCGESMEEVRAAAVKEGRLDGSFSKRCGMCKP